MLTMPTSSQKPKANPKLLACDFVKHFVCVCMFAVMVSDDLKLLDDGGDIPG